MSIIPSAPLISGAKTCGRWITAQRLARRGFEGRGIAEASRGHDCASVVHYKADRASSNRMRAAVASSAAAAALAARSCRATTLRRTARGSRKRSTIHRHGRKQVHLSGLCIGRCGCNHAELQMPHETQAGPNGRPHKSKTYGRIETWHATCGDRGRHVPMTWVTVGFMVRLAVRSARGTGGAEVAGIAGSRTCGLRSDDQTFWNSGTAPEDLNLGLGTISRREDAIRIRTQIRSEDSSPSAGFGLTEIRLTADTTQIALEDGSSINGQATLVQSGTTKVLGNATLATEADTHRVVEAITTSSGNRTVTQTGYDAGGGVVFVVKSTTNAAGTSITNRYDDNGDGVVDRFQTIVVTTGGAGERIETRLDLYRRHRRYLSPRFVTGTSTPKSSKSLARWRKK